MFKYSIIMAKIFETKFPKVENNLNRNMEILSTRSVSDQLPKPVAKVTLAARYLHRGCMAQPFERFLDKRRNDHDEEKGQLGKRYSRNGLHNQICTVQWLESHTVYSTQTHPKRSKDDFFVLDDNLLSIFLSFCFFFFSSCFLHIVLLISALSWESLFISC